MPSRLEQLQQMLLQEPNDRFLQYAIAIEYFSSGQVQKAIGILNEIIDQDPDYLAVYYQLGKCYEATERIEDAITVYNKGILVAQKLGKQKTLGELREALFLLED